MKSKRVTVTVENVFSFGVFVRLPDGTEGYVRRRELAWEKNADPRQLVAVGDTFEAEILPQSESGEGRRLELSRRATLESPWQAFFRRYRRGDIVQGRVINVTPFGVFVEILPGVDGLVPLQDLSSLGGQKPDDLLWVGDIVEAVITRLGRRDRKVCLSIGERIRQLDRAAVKAFLSRSPEEGVPIAEQVGLSVTEVKRKIESEREEEKSQTVDPQRIGPILVVDADAAVRHPLVEWFRHQGYQVSGAESAAAALESLSSQPCGLVLVEANLPGGEGLSFLNQIGQRQPPEKGSVVAVMGSVEGIEKRIAELENLAVAEILVKPLDLSEVERLLGRIERDESLVPWTGWSDEMTEGVASESFRRHVELGTLLARHGTPLAQQLEALLSQLVKTTQAEVGLLLHRDPISHAISVLAQAGNPDVPLNEKALYSLEESPVKDVIREERWVLESAVSRKAGRFRKLLDLLPFESCIGVPVGDQGDYSHALFVFHRAPQAFSRYRLRDAWAMATRMAAAIERDQVDRLLGERQGLLLLGQLAASFAHEIANKVSGVELGLRNLHMGCQALDGKDGDPPLKDSPKFRDLQRTLDTVLDLKKTVRLFQQLTRSRSEPALNVNQVVEQVARQLHAMAYQNNVEIQASLASDLPRPAGDATQLQQVILNLMLNAIQQMALKSKAGGTLEVKTGTDHDDGQRRIAIRVKDEGPGIHRQLWEKIFSLGYSTRPGGTGLGLFVARSLTESLGGRLVVEQSVIPIGTTFLIELPVSTKEGGRE